MRMGSGIGTTRQGSRVRWEVLSECNFPLVRLSRRERRTVNM